MLQGFAMQRIDAAAVLCFALVFVLSVVNVPFEAGGLDERERIRTSWIECFDLSVLRECFCESVLR